MSAANRRTSLRTHQEQTEQGTPRSNQGMRHNNDRNQPDFDGADLVRVPRHQASQLSQQSAEVSSSEEDNSDDENEVPNIAYAHLPSPMAKKEKMVPLAVGKNVAKATVVADAKRKLDSLYEAYSSTYDKCNHAKKRERSANSHVSTLTTRVASLEKKNSSLQNQLHNAKQATEKFKQSASTRKDKIEVLEEALADSKKSSLESSRLQKKVSELEEKNVRLTIEMNKLKTDKAVAVEAEKTRRKELDARMKNDAAENAQTMNERKLELVLGAEKAKAQLKFDSKAAELDQKANSKNHRFGSMLASGAFHGAGGSKAGFNINSAAYAPHERLARGFLPHVPGFANMIEGPPNLEYVDRYDPQPHTREAYYPYGAPPTREAHYAPPPNHQPNQNYYRAALQQPTYQMASTQQHNPAHQRAPTPNYQNQQIWHTQTPEYRHQPTREPTPNYHCRPHTRTSGEYHHQPIQHVPRPNYVAQQVATRSTQFGSGDVFYNDDFAPTGDNVMAPPDERYNHNNFAAPNEDNSHFNQQASHPEGRGVWYEDSGADAVVTEGVPLRGAGFSVSVTALEATSSSNEAEADAASFLASLSNR